MHLFLNLFSGHLFESVSFLGTSAAAANSNIVTSSTEPLEGAPLVLQLVTGAKVGGEANGA